MPHLSSEVADWVVGLSLDDVPPQVVRTARLCILDQIGVMLASSRLGAVEAVRRSLRDADGGGRGARSLGSAEEMSPAGAAFVNGVASSVLEFDDTHIASNIHPTGVVLAALLAEAQRVPVSGRRFVDAVLAGSEVFCRLGLVSPVRLHEVGFHPTGVYGAFAAVYAVARLRRLPARVTAHAVGIAGSLSSGSISAFQDGADSKILHVGFAAAAGLRAVALAAEGLTGPDAIFEGRFGWYRSYVQGDVAFRFEALTAELGARWEVLNIAPKLYPCAYTLMPFIHAALELRSRHAFAPEDVVEIRCEIMPRSFRTVCEPVEEKRRPRTSWHGRISLQHSVAEAIVLGRFDKSSYGEASLRDPIINALADKVVHVADPIAAADVGRSRGVVSIALADGRVIRHTVEDMPGTRRNPAGEEVHLRKVRSNLDGVIDSAAADRLIDDLLHLDDVPDVRAVLAPFER